MILESKVSDHGGVPECGIVESGVDYRGIALAMSEKSPGCGEPDAVHDALGSPSVATVVNAEAEQPRLFSDADPL